jgi:hypothetical protein
MLESSNSVEKTLPLIIAEKKYEWSEQYITGLQIKKLAHLPLDSKILLAIKRPWDDEMIEDDTSVDLAREGVEHFIVKSPHEDFLVEIHINDQPHKIKRGKHSVAQLREIGHVPPTHLFAELVDEKLVELKSDTVILIKGCEQFFSYTPEGCSS